jgi:DNA-binding NarL/FixJ family response regulator
VIKSTLQPSRCVTLPQVVKVPTDFSQNSKVILARHWVTKTEALNGSIAVVKSSVLPEGIVRTLHATFPRRIVTYSTFSQIVSERRESLPRLIMVGTEIANGTIESVMRSLSHLVPRIPTVVLAPKDDVDLARKMISLGAKAFIPLPTRCEVVAVIRFILIGAA